MGPKTQNPILIIKATILHGEAKTLPSGPSFFSGAVLPHSGSSIYGLGLGRRVEVTVQ